MQTSIKDQLRSGGFTIPKTSLEATNLRLLDRNSAGAFAGIPGLAGLKPNDWRAFVEFDICHSLPVVAQPASGTGNITAFHPASLAASYQDLLCQQGNLEHLVKHHDPDRISHDRIISCIVGVSFPPEPEGGWKIPADKASAIPIRCCAVVFKIAHGAVEMLNEHLSGQRKWSVSIEVMGRAVDEMGIYQPSTGDLYPLLDAPDLFFEALTRKNDGRLCLGKIRSGEQLALVYGGTGNPIIFQGVGFTAMPASLEAEITSVQLSAQKPPASEIITKPEGVAMLQASSANIVLAAGAAEKKFPGARVLSVTHSGKAILPGRTWCIPATSEDPVASIRLASGALILKRMSEL